MNRGKLIFLAVCAAVSAAVIASSASYGKPADKTGDLPGASGAAIQAEAYVRSGMPFRDRLIRLGDKIGELAGRNEIYLRDSENSGDMTGIFVGSGSLMKNIEEPVDDYVRDNLAAIEEFADHMRQERKQTYFMLVPTSGAIMQQELPKYASSVMVNQRRFIEDAYGSVSASVTTVDAYSALIARQTQYIYYRTENNLTSLGGYYVYAAMLSRLGLGRADLNQFDVDYKTTPFYGDLYREAGYADVMPDSVSLFRYSESNSAPHEYLVTHMNGGETKTYHTLYPESAVSFGQETDIFLGGISAVTDIKTASPYSSKILVFGDKTALAYAPLLANNCDRLTILDLSGDSRAFSGIDIYEYDKIMFAYGVEDFMHTDVPARALTLAQL